MNPFFRIDFSISDSLKTVRKSVLIYETIIKDVPEFKRENEEADIEKEWVPLKEAAERVKSGEIDDAKTVIGILMTDSMGR